MSFHTISTYGGTTQAMLSATASCSACLRTIASNHIEKIPRNAAGSLVLTGIKLSLIFCHPQSSALRLLPSNCCTWKWTRNEWWLAVSRVGGRIWGSTKDDLFAVCALKSLVLVKLRLSLTFWLYAISIIFSPLHLGGKRSRRNFGTILSKTCQVVFLYRSQTIRK